MAFVKVECKDCVFWTPSPSGINLIYGRCHFDPKAYTGKVGQQSVRDEDRWENPLTGANDWCSHGAKK